MFEVSVIENQSPVKCSCDGRKRIKVIVPLRSFDDSRWIVLKKVYSFIKILFIYTELYSYSRSIHNKFLWTKNIWCVLLTSFIKSLIIYFYVRPNSEKIFYFTTLICVLLISILKRSEVGTTIMLFYFIRGSIIFKVTLFSLLLLYQ